MREVCAKEKMALGGELCSLFYSYLAGYLGRLGNKRLKLANAERAMQRCYYEIDLI